MSGRDPRRHSRCVLLVLLVALVVVRHIRQIHEVGPLACAAHIALSIHYDSGKKIDSLQQYMKRHQVGRRKTIPHLTAILRRHQCRVHKSERDAVA